MGLVNNFNVNSGYRNARVRNAITGVDGQGFVGGRRGSAIQMNDGRLGRASLVRGALPVTPGRESLRLSDRAVGMNSLPRGRNDTRFVSRQQPARVDRIPFEDQRRGMEQMTRRTFSDQRSSAVNSSGPAGRGGQGMGGVQRGATPASSQATGASGWRRFSEPLGGSGRSAVRTPQDRPGGGGLRTPQSSQPNLQDRGVSRNSGDGWSRFGTGSGATSRDLGFGSSSPRSVERGQNSRGNGGSLRTPQSSQPNPQDRGVSRNSGDGWSRFGTGSGTTNRDLGFGSSNPRSAERGQNYRGNGGSVAPRSASPRYESPRTSSPQLSRGAGQAQVRVNPPIVRERAPNYGGGGSSYSRPAPSGGGNYSRSTPSYSGGGYSRSAPSSGGGGSYSRSAPSGGGNYSRSTPSSGGGNRSSGGGGGGGRGGRSR